MNDSTCTVVGCNRAATNRTLLICSAHYRRYWRYGDTQAERPLAAPRSAPIPLVEYPDNTRECAQCHQRLPLEGFHNDARAPGGKRKTCKTCRVSSETARYHANTEAVKERVRKYRQSNAEQVRARDSARYERDRPKRIELATAHSHARRARMAGQPRDKGISVTSLRSRDGDLCHYCSKVMIFMVGRKGDMTGDRATLEHKQAISRGGSHTWDNCVLACWRCNSSKGAKSLNAFLSAQLSAA